MKSGACPHCSKPFRIQTMLSGKHSDARYWSDGKCDAPMLPDYPAVARCPHCRSIFWVEDTIVLGEESCYSRPPAGQLEAPWIGARGLDHLDGEGYEEAIACNSDRERERFLRVCYLHCVNDQYRDTLAIEDSKASMTPQHQANRTLCSPSSARKSPRTDHEGRSLPRTGQLPGGAVASFRCSRRCFMGGLAHCRDGCGWDLAGVRVEVRIRKNVMSNRSHWLPQIIAVGVLLVGLNWGMNQAVARDVCNCKGYSGPGCLCYSGPGGDAHPAGLRRAGWAV